MSAAQTTAAGMPVFQAPRPQGFAAKWIVPNLGAGLALLLLPIVVFTSVPFSAWGVAFGAWVVNRIGHAVTVAFTNGLPQTLAVGAAGFGMMLRVWVIAFGLFFIGADLHVGEVTVGLDKPDVAVPAMLLFLLLFTVDVISRVLVAMRMQAVTPADQAVRVADAATEVSE